MKKKQQVYIFSNALSSRLRYINHIVFEHILGFELNEVIDFDAFKKIKSPKINYSQLKIEDSFQILPADILFEKGIRQQKLNSVVTENIPYLFSTENEDIGFDPLAACFYVVSRYEEYLPYTPDKHDRFPSSASILKKLDCLHLPIVQVWIQKLQESLGRKFPSLVFKKTPFSYRPSFDIDMAWSYKEKGLYRTLGAATKDLLTFNFANLQKRMKVAGAIEKDPFDTFDYILAQTTAHKQDPIFFFLMGKHSDYDKNTNPTNSKFITLIKKIASSSQVGIHPSYYSEKNLLKEINYLNAATGSKATASRQHFVKLTFPTTYQHLIANHIESDYSMGFPDAIGFRNGLAIPTLWYDLEKEEMTNLMIHPFQIMDVTLKNYLALKPEEAIREIKTICQTIQQYGGTMISIWHNSSFDKGWNGWAQVFEEMLSYTREE